MARDGGLHVALVIVRSRCRRGRDIGQRNEGAGKHENDGLHAQKGGDENGLRTNRWLQQQLSEKSNL